MIKHEISSFSLSNSSFEVSVTQPVHAHQQAHAAHATADSSYQAPAVSALFFVAAMFVLATELVERLGRRSSHEIGAVAQK